MDPSCSPADFANILARLAQLEAKVIEQDRIIAEQQQIIVEQRATILTLREALDTAHEQITLLKKRLFSAKRERFLYYDYRPSRCRAGPSIMRKSFSGLVGLVEKELGQQVEAGGLFLFFSRRRNAVKVLFFTGDGLAIFSRRPPGTSRRLPNRPLVRRPSATRLDHR